MRDTGNFTVGLMPHRLPPPLLLHCIICMCIKRRLINKNTMASVSQCIRYIVADSDGQTHFLDTGLININQEAILFLIYPTDANWLVF